MKELLSWLILGRFLDILVGLSEHPEQLPYIMSPSSSKLSNIIECLVLCSYIGLSSISICGGVVRIEVAT